MGSFVARIGGIAAPYLISVQDNISWLPNAIFGGLGKFKTFIFYWVIKVVFVDTKELLSLPTIKSKA